jgi:hypothetical protein
VGRKLRSPIVNEVVDWKFAVHGGGGLITKVNSSSDGTMVCGTDVSGGYVYNTVTQQWDNISHAHRTKYTRQRGITRLDGVSDIVIAWSDSNRIYHFNSVEGPVRQGRLYRSNDKGVTSFPTNYIYEGGGVGTELEGNDTTNKTPDGKIAVDPSDPDIVYAAYPGRPPVRSFDGGVNWSTVPNLPTGTNIGTVYINFDRSSALIGGRTSVIYCMIWGTGIYRTEDAGETWTQISSTINNPNRNADVSADGKFYCGYSTGGNHRAVGRYIHGSGWTDVRTNNLGNAYIVACHRTDPGILVALTSIEQSYQYSSDSGDNWTTRAKAVQTFTCTYAPWLEDRSEVLSGSITDAVWEGNNLWYNAGQAMCRVTNASSAAPTNELIVKGIEEIVGLQVTHPGPGRQIFYGSQDEGAWRRNTSNAALDSPPTSAALVLTEGVASSALYQTYMLRADPQDLDTMIFLNVGTIGSGYTNDAGVSFNAFVNSHPQDGLIYPTGDINDGVIIWCAAVSNDSRPYRSADFGATAWTQLTNGGTWTSGNLITGWHHTIQQLATTIVADTVHADKWYIANHARNTVWRSTDRGLTWVEGSNVTGYGTIAQYIRTMVQPFGYENHLWISNGPNAGTGLPPYSTNAVNILQYSTNGGDSWTSFSSDIKDPYRFGFGKPRKVGEYPTLYIECCFKRIYGIWRFDNADPTTARRLLCLDGDFLPAHCNAQISWITGDHDIYGRCYVNTGQQCLIYCDRY